MADPASSEPLALYIHWPFCIKKCPYCDFNSHVRTGVDQEDWAKALLWDLQFEALQMAPRPLTSIFFGGGTPSLMPPETVGQLLETAEQLFGFADDMEITLEANPSSVEAARFADLARAGVNRLSLGMQALDDAALRFLGRPHDLAEGLAALDVAQAQFPRVSFDLIYARPDQTPEAWAQELAEALSFGTEHLSLYQLTIEPGTQFATLEAKGQLPVFDPDLAADMFDATDAQARAAGLFRYETSNHAAKGAESRHNLTYWRYGDYLGIGPGAHGRRGGVATERHKKPENFLSALARNQNGLSHETILSPELRAREALVMGLRLAEGVNPASIAERTGLAMEAFLDLRKVEQLEQQGLLISEGEQKRLSAKAMGVLDAVLREIAIV
jgi:putative oxygen-independent coproporphyrinogen III oxidase